MSGSGECVNLDNLVSQATDDIHAAKSEAELEKLRVYLFGKKGQITALLKSIGKLPPEERPAAGKRITNSRKKIEQQFQCQLKLVKANTEIQRLESEKVDVTLPARQLESGGPHPLSRTLQRVQEIFSSVGFDTAVGPEIEDDFHNFEALNIPADHPARAMQDTFYFHDSKVLRTHTSPVQIRYMEVNKPPIRIIAPGRVYRCDSDMTHSPMFHQVEGLVVDEHTTFADLKGILEYFAVEFFEKDLRLRFRPSYFPFTEPSAEVDISCVFCGGVGCNVCKYSGWIEVLGCGMVHPALYPHVNIDSERYTGYAFGMGVERLTMLRYGINDLRMFFRNELDMLYQFR